MKLKLSRNDMAAKTNNPNSLLMSLNVLDHPTVSSRMDHAQLHPESPVSIKLNLELDQLDQNLFPSLTTGVRWWPFLCLALDCTTEADYKRVFIITRRLKRDMKTNARIGPSTKASFRPYRSMAKNIQENASCFRLLQYLKGLRFDGKKSFFVNYDHEIKWRKLFLASNGKPARAYLQAHSIASRKNKASGVLDVVTVILKRKYNEFDPILWRGCFSFAFLRCLYGTFDRQEGEPTSYGDYALVWKEALLDVLKNPPPNFPDGALNPAYVHLLNKIENKDSPPPLAAQTIQFRSQDRPVLAALRIPLFHTLYFKPHPSRLMR